jgi:hypothetical protein
MDSASISSYDDHLDLNAVPREPRQVAIDFGRVKERTDVG